MDVLSLQQNDKPTSPHRRMEALAKLPVFWDLNDKPVLVAGGSEAAAWKVELMAACGAAVHVYLSGEKPCPILSELAADQSHIQLFNSNWAMVDLSAFALVIADFDHDAEALAFFSTARQAGVPVNVIDKPTYCQFQFGSIVNRSPVVIAISTDGAAPILAQAIRRRIETLLPPALRGWAQLARKIRPDVTEGLNPGTPRRMFWERFVDMAFRGNRQPDANDEAELAAALQKISTLGAPSFGCVTFVGAGPGDAEMLTLKAVRSLQSADVIFYDAGINADILELARREAKRLLVGADIGYCDAIIALVRTGKRVVRLVAGEAACEGRIADEKALFERAGMVPDFVPGARASESFNSHLAFDKRIAN
jgi:uroporphyrin-III C-methyltransferase / precorrin-2 dehydrogenase / sirohydrochlorin ferrochelatase